MQKTITDSIDLLKAEISIRIKYLQEEEGPLFVNEMLGIICKRLPAEIENIAWGSETSNYELVEEYAHKVMGTFRLFELKAAVEVAKNVEEFAIARDVSNMNKHTLALLNYLKAMLISAQLTLSAAKN